MTTPENVNLFVTFKLAGETQSHLSGAARIEVDGRGCLTVYDAGSGLGHTVRLADLQSLSIQSMGCAGRAA